MSNISDDEVLDRRQESNELEFQDTFLPKDTDRLKADIKRLRRQLTDGIEEVQRLRRQIIEEDISQIVVSKITQMIKDPTQVKPEQLDGIQKDIFNEMMEAIYQCSVKEVISYHRLTGVTSYSFRKIYVGYRLETFYKKRYNKSYYLLFHKNDPTKLRGHSIPPVVPTSSLAAKLLPDNLDAFIRNIHSCLQGYVYRNEVVKEIEQIGRETGKIEVKLKDQARINIILLITSKGDDEFEVALRFGSFTSRFPTKVVIKKSGDEESYDYVELETLFKENDLLEVIRSIIDSKM